MVLEERRVRADIIEVYKVIYSLSPIVVNVGL